MLKKPIIEIPVQKNSWTQNMQNTHVVLPPIKALLQQLDAASLMSEHIYGDTQISMSFKPGRDAEKELVTPLPCHHECDMNAT